MFHISLDCLYSFLKVLSTKFPLKKSPTDFLPSVKNPLENGSYISSSRSVKYSRNHPKAHRSVGLLCWTTCPPPWDHTSRVPWVKNPPFENRAFMKGMNGSMDFPKYFFVHFFCQDFQKPRYCISLWWRSMLLFERRVSVSSQSSYQGGDGLSNCCYRVHLHLTCNVQACTSLLWQLVARSPQTKHLKQPHDFQPGNPYLN